MYPVSKAYRENIVLHRTRAIRNASTVQVTFGQFDISAPADATISASAGGVLSALSNINSNDVQRCSYASWENNFFVLNGLQKIPPSSPSSALRQGYLSLSCSLADRSFSSNPYIHVAFSVPHTMVGITLLFDDIGPAYPTDMIITTYLSSVQVQTFTVTNNSYLYAGTLLLEAFDEMTIQFVKTVAPYQRIHVQHLLFGIGYEYTGDVVTRVELNHEQNPVSLELPCADLSFELFNDGRFALDSGSSIVDFFDNTQIINCMFGYDVTGLGDYEYVHFPPQFLKSWDVRGIKASFTCEDHIARLTKTTFYKGRYGSRKIRDVAIEVAQDAGITNFDFDSYELNAIYITNPLPIDTHAACLQLLANAAMCVIDVTLDGTIVLRSRKPPIPVSALPGGDSRIFNSIAANLTDYDLEPVVYATWEPDHFALDGNMKVPPTTAPYINTDIVYADQPVGEVYSDDPHVCVNFDAAVSFGSIRLYFGVYNCPTKIRLRGVRNTGDTTILVLDKTYTIDSSPSVVLCDAFDRITQLYVHFVYDGTNTRPRIQQVECSWDTGFDITADDIFKNPQGEKLPLCKNLIVPATDYTVSASVEQIATQTIAADVMAHIEFGDPHTDVTVTCAAEGSIVTFTAYAYAVDVTVTGVTGDVEVIISGKKLSASVVKRTTVINSTGEDVEITNPLLANANVTAAYIAWLVDYFKCSMQWQPDVMGFPEVQISDLIRYKNNKAYITEYNLVYAGGSRETFTLRKEVSQ